MKLRGDVCVCAYVCMCCPLTTCRTGCCETVQARPSGSSLGGSAVAPLSTTAAHNGAYVLSYAVHFVVVDVAALRPCPWL